VTRIARVTGLDRTGVEVASAIRPRGHVLAVSNGKGLTFEAATAGALHEAAELWAAERPVSLVSGTPAEVRARFGATAVLEPEALEPGAFAPEARVAWCTAEELATGARVLVPASAVFCPPPGTPSLGPANVRWTSNGMGAARDRLRAVAHALCEVIERDRLARALPEGFTEGEIARRLVDRTALPRPVDGLVRDLEARRFGVYFLDLDARLDSDPDPDPDRHRDPDPDPDLDLDPDLDPDPDPDPGRHRGRNRHPDRRRHLTPAIAPAAFAAVLVDRDEGPVPVAAGYACRLDAGAALTAALLEAAQSRATEIHGAREDVASGDRRAGAPLADLLARAAPAVGLRPDRARAGRRDALAHLVAAATRGGTSPIACVDLAGPAELHVVKLVAPGLLLSELL
jgi:ribosomal protein S12 methylthiotransferase accessory factor